MGIRKFKGNPGVKLKKITVDIMTSKYIVLKELLSIFIVALGISMANAQSNPTIIPPSPTTREFTKYINHEVALYNGIPDINIPLYNIQLKGLTIPITLSYHASGIKYGQDNGDVGVGWVLNPGYRVSRNIYGYADELVSMPSDLITTVSNYEANAAGGNTPGKVERDKYLSKLVPGNYFGNGALDGEYDQYTFSTPTASGGFIIADRTNKTVITTEESNLLVDYKSGGSICSLVEGIKGVQIIDHNGIKYSFGEYNPQTQCMIETASAYYGGMVATAWGISEINTPAGEEVKFKYSRSTTGEVTSHMRSASIVEAAYNPSPGCDVETIYNEDPYTGAGYASFSPDEIITPNESVKFFFSQDLLFPKKISKIEIRSPGGALLKTIKLFYVLGSHHTFLDHVTIQDNAQVDVETFHFEYYTPNVIEPFTVDHYGNYLIAPAQGLFYHQEFMDDPVTLTTSQSGYISCVQGTVNTFMGGLGTSREPSAVPSYFSLKKIIYPTGGYTEYEYEHGKFRDVGGSGPARNAGLRIKSIRSFNAPSQQLLERHYTYGTNEDGVGVAHPWVMYPESLFVRETMQFSIGTTGLKTLHRIVNYSTQMQGDIGAIFSQSGYVKYPFVTEYNSDPALPLKPTGKSVYNFDLGQMFDMRILSTRNSQAGFYQGTPNYVYRYRLWDKPVMTRKINFAHNGTSFHAVTEEILNYERTLNTVVGLKVEQAVSNQNSVINNESYGSTPGQPGDIFERYFNYGEYYIEIGKNVLTQKIEHNYLNGQTLTTTSTYDYSNHLPAIETMSNSTGATIVTYTTYPKDYAAGTGFINDMITSNMVAYPIEQVKYIEEGGSQKILAGQITTYKAGGKGLKDAEFALETTTPVTLSTFKFSNRAIGQLPPLTGTATTFAADAKYKSRITYDSYDAKGNLLSATNDGALSSSYLWGYNETFPIAKIDNAKYDATGIAVNGQGETVFTRVNELSFENFEEHSARTSSATAHTGRYVYQGSFDVELRDKIPGNYLLVYWSSTNGVDWTKQEVKLNVTSTSGPHSIGSALTYLDDIRLHPIDAQMSTYTYDPLVGMTSQTDAAGITTYFQYDAYGRLMEVRDDKRNVLKQVKYHYKQ